jgi:hypothetical protein
MAEPFSLSDRNAPGNPILVLQVSPEHIAGGCSIFGPWLRIRLDPGPAFRQPPPKTSTFLGGKLCWEGEIDGAIIPLQSIAPYEWLTIALTDEQLCFVERKRQGQRATFHLHLAGFTSLEGSQLRDIRIDGIPTRLSITRDKWCELLKTMNFGSRKLIELPPPAPPFTETFNAVAEHIALAASLLGIYEVDRAVSETRVAITNLVEAIGTSVGRPRKDKDAAFANYANNVCDRLEEFQTRRSAEQFGIVAQSVRLALAIFRNASDPIHRGLSTATYSETALLVGLSVALYSYCTRLPNIMLTESTPKEPVPGA